MHHLIYQWRIYLPLVVFTAYECGQRSQDTKKQGGYHTVYSRSHTILHYRL